MVSEDALVAAARAARERAIAPYSHFAVGSAVETADGAVVTGCNIENATYGLTVCAERVAMFKALSDGQRLFTRVVVVADTVGRVVLPPSEVQVGIMAAVVGVPVFLALIRRTGRAL